MKAKPQWKRFYKVISGCSGQQRHAAVCQAGDYASRYQTVESTLEIMEINCITCPNAQTATSPVTRLIQPQRHPVAAVDSTVLMAADVISVTSWRRSTAAGHLQGSALFCFLEPGRLVVGIILRVATAERKQRRNKAARDVEQVDGAGERRGKTLYDWSRSYNSVFRERDPARGKKKTTPQVFSAKTFWAPCSVGTSQGLISPLQATTSLQINSSSLKPSEIEESSESRWGHSKISVVVCGHRNLVGGQISHH